MIGDKELALPAKMLDLHATRHKLIAHNIANAEVPGFKKLSAEFGREFINALQNGDEESLRSSQVKVKQAAQPGVEGEAEVAGMAKNELLFNTYAEIASFRMRMLRSAITSK